MIVLTWLTLTASRPHWLTTPWRWAALLGIQTTEPVALAVPALLGQLAVVTLAWTSRPLEPHPLAALTSAPALAVIAFSLLFTIGTLGPLGALPLGVAAALCLLFHWHWHEHLGGATAARLRRAGECAECAALTFSAWLF